MQVYDFFGFILKVSFVMIVLLSILFGVIIPFIQGISKKNGHRTVEGPVYGQSQRMAGLKIEEDEIEIPAPARSQAELNREILKMALEDPATTSRLVRNWIQEKT